MNQVADRVDLCFKAYERELNQKRERLKDLLNNEEQMNMYKFTEQAQNVSNIQWKEKMDRLAYLLEKRQKEHESQFQDMPLTKSPHVLPCLVKLRAKEAEEIQLYQMREKKLRKEAEREMDQMWYDVAMRESDALAARMEYDSIQRAIRDKERADHSAQQREMLRIQRVKDQERLKQEMLKLNAEIEQIAQEDKEAARKHQIMIQKEKERRTNDLIELKKYNAEIEASNRVIEETWESLSGQSLADDRSEAERRKQKERELDECNKKMAEMKKSIADFKCNNEPLIFEEGQRIRDAVDLKRCQYRARLQKRFKETQNFNKHHVKDKGEETLETNEYERMVAKQLDQLVQHKQITDAQARKMHQKELLQQIEYNKLLKDRARQEALEQEKKCQIAMGEYQEQINEMLKRPFYSDHLNPFMKQMASGLKMTVCPCSKVPYCIPVKEIIKSKTKE